MAARHPGRARPAHRASGRRQSRAPRFVRCWPWPTSKADRTDDAAPAAGGVRGRRLRAPAGLDAGSPEWSSTREAAIECRDPKYAAPLFDRLAPWADQLSTAAGAAADGPVSHYLGGLATVLGRYDEADAYFTQAAAFNNRVSAKFFAARTNLSWGRMLAERDAPGDTEKARDLLTKAHDRRRGQRVRERRTTRRPSTTAPRLTTRRSAQRVSENAWQVATEACGITDLPASVREWPGVCSQCAPRLLAGLVRTGLDLGFSQRLQRCCKALYTGSIPHAGTRTTDTVCGSYWAAMCPSVACSRPGVGRARRGCTRRLGRRTWRFRSRAPRRSDRGRVGLGRGRGLLDGRALTTCRSDDPLGDGTAERRRELRSVEYRRRR